MGIEVYGIPNCDTVKKARAWLDARGLAHAFHDYKKEGVDPARLAGWGDAVGWEALLNRRGTTFRGLSDADKADIDRAKALRLMVANPSLIKRPVVEHAAGVLVGFDAGAWEATL
ncbi:MAG TPA: arsenate reductase [Croceibacterium sp.]|nr:arsenate reductase [Croceibacterium sp.]